ncbi:MAG: sarcosine oxidase subunit gamma [Proteobacteria bacterium]|nr:sarcosine oxidase subunit gamma [Pseudomonadota bacterium]
MRAEQHSAIVERPDVAVTHISARRGMLAGLNDAARAAFGVEFPLTPRALDAHGMTIVWAGPEQWLLIEPASKGVDPSLQHAKTFSGFASVVDVSDSRTIFQMAISRPSDVLVQSMGIDFEDTSFKPGDVAITHVSHLGVMVWRLPDGRGYEFACARTYTKDFRSWLDRF